MLHLPYRAVLIIIITIIFLLVSVCLSAQVKYSEPDKSLIFKNRKQANTAIKDWNRKKLYHLGVFFEGIYNKYKDSSMAAAIRCYTISASSESEYGNLKECYAAAGKLAKIYEMGKGVSIQPLRAMIYYYLSDTRHTATYNTLGNPTHNAGFQRIRNSYCARDIVTVFKSGSRIDSLIIYGSPFCKNDGNRIKLALSELSEYLKQVPEKNVDVTISGGPSVPAAQYTLKVENFILPAIYSGFISTMTGEGVANERILPLKREQFESPDYKFILRIVQ
jgi:hypothetical protein